MSASQADQVSRLEARIRRLRSALGIGRAVLLVPGYLFAAFCFLRWLEPRALGTYSFLVGGPILLAVCAAQFAGQGFLKSFTTTTAGTAVLAVGLYFAGLESGLCLVILLLPFVALGGLVSLIFSGQDLRRASNSLRSLKGTVLLLLLVPIGALFEHHTLEAPSSQMLTSSVLVSAEPAVVWSVIVQVAPFTEQEIPRTWLQYLGVPRPIRATVDTVRKTPIRVGYFEKGLRFTEHFNTFRPPSELGLSVTVDGASLAVDEVAQHAFSHGFLEIDDVRNLITPTSEGVRLSLTCSYTLHTSVPGYAHAVAEVVGRFRMISCRLLLDDSKPAGRKVEHCSLPIVAEFE